MTVTRRNQIEDVPGFLRGLGIKGVKDGTEVAFCCPFHGDNDPSASMNKMTTAWFCHGCHEKGNAVTLAKKLGGELPFSLGLPEDEDDLLAYVHEMTRDQVLEEPVDEVIQTPIDSMYMRAFEVNWPVQRNGNERLWRYLKSRFIHPKDVIEEIAWESELGYDLYSDRITIPIIDHRGLWGFKARAIRPDQLPRYMALGGEAYGFEPFKSGGVMLNYRPVKKGGYLVIVEGEFNSLVVDHIWGFGDEIVVAGLSGSVLTESHIQQVLEHPPARVILYFDDDMPGATGAWHAYQRLSPYTEVLTVGPHAKDACETSLDEVRKLLDNPVDTLLRLIGDETWAKASKTF